MKIFEVIAEKPPQDVIDAYSYGRCMWLSLALFRRFGWPMFAQISDDGSYIAHSYNVMPDGNEIDILGPQKQVDMFSSGKPRQFTPEGMIDFINQVTFRGKRAVTQAEIQRELTAADRMIDQYVLPHLAQQEPTQFRSDPRFEAIRRKAQTGISVWRGVHPSGPADPGDFGRGTYYSTSRVRAKQHGTVGQHVLQFKNPIVLDVHAAYDLGDQYGTVRGNTADRQAGALRLNQDLRAAGHDGLISVNSRRASATTQTELEIVDLRLTEAVQISGKMIAGESPIVRFRQDAARIEASLPPIPMGHVRLWRGNRPGEIGNAQSFTSDLPGIALPFREPYGGDISYVDVPQAQLPPASRGGAPGVEFYLPRELAQMARPVGVEIVGGR